MSSGPTSAVLTSAHRTLIACWTAADVAYFLQLQLIGVDPIRVIARWLSRETISSGEKLLRLSEVDLDT
jgi:hypothetical protein